LHQNLESRYNSGNACYRSFQNLLSSCLLSKNIKLKIHKNINLLLILYGCDTWSPILREDYKLRVFENRVLRKVYGAWEGESKDEAGEGFIMHSITLLYAPPNTSRVIKSRRLKRVGACVTLGGEEKCMRGFGGET